MEPPPVARARSFRSGSAARRVSANWHRPIVPEAGRRPIELWEQHVKDYVAAQG